VLPLDFGLDGKMAIVTGSGSGIGRILALGLAQAGAHIVVADLAEKREVAEETARAVRGTGRRALVSALDVTEVESIEAMVEKACSSFDRVDILVNNAGTIVRKKALEVTEEDWDRVLDTNLKGALFASQVAAKAMVEQGRGKIVNIASVNGIIGSPERAAYTASKAGLINLTRTLAAEWAQHGINVNAIGPTYLLTPFTQVLFDDEDFRQGYFRRQPIQRIGRPEDLDGAAVYLASPASDLVTGHTLMVDGGWTAV
jgi:2-dehydro-3-deoxy-D-gluconate 5-dehydrogenase